MKLNMKLVKQSALFGVFLILVGSVVGGILSMFFKVSLPEICKSWNKNHIMELSLFFSGFIAYYTFSTFKLYRWL